MITQEQITIFETKPIDNGDAQEYASTIIQSLTLSTASSRGAITNCIASLSFKDDISKALFKKIKDEIFDDYFRGLEKLEKKVKAEKKANKASINKACTAILSTAVEMTSSETQFLNDIKTKRKLTDKQESWLRALATKASVGISGDFERKATGKKNVNHCEHEDLGSLGYRHGDIVKCPHCGHSAEVW